jgi:hypothetical protein
MQREAPVIFTIPPTIAVPSCYQTSAIHAVLPNPFQVPTFRRHRHCNCHLSRTSDEYLEISGIERAYVPSHYLPVPQCTIGYTEKLNASCDLRVVITAH